MLPFLTFLTTVSWTCFLCCLCPIEVSLLSAAGGLSLLQAGAREEDRTEEGRGTLSGHYSQVTCKEMDALKQLT
jgi:hypothetical protein